MKSLKLIAILSGVLAFGANAASYQYGKVTELAVENEMFSFQIDTTNGTDMRDPTCSTTSPLNFKVTPSPFQNELFQAVMESKLTGRPIGVNGMGDCHGTESETVSRLALGDFLPNN